MVHYRLDGSLYSTPRFGGCRNPQYTITLAVDEFIERIEGSTNGVVLDQISITTFEPSKHERRIYGPFGNSAQQTYSEGYTTAFYGRCGDYINNLGVLVLAPLEKSNRFVWWQQRFRVQ